MQFSNTGMKTKEWKQRKHKNTQQKNHTQIEVQTRYNTVKKIVGKE